MCVREQRHGKVVFQQSCMKFNLLSQKVFNPFSTVILLNLGPKWGHLGEQPALSPTKTIKISNHSRGFSVKQAPNMQTCIPDSWGLYFEQKHPENSDGTLEGIILHLPRVSTLPSCGVMNWHGYKWMDMPD